MRTVAAMFSSSGRPTMDSYRFMCIELQKVGLNFLHNSEQKGTW